MITISNKAAERLREQLLHKCFETGIGFRMLVNSGESGKSTLSIKVDKQQPRDEVIDLDRVKVFLDPFSAAQIRDYQLDYQDEPDGGFFLKTG